MSRKRRNTSSAEPETPPDASHDTKEYSDFESPSDNPEQPLVDSRYGQVGAFPGLADDDTLYYGPPADGIDYLRMVRSEASGIPLFLTATNTEQRAQTGNDAYDDAYEGFFDQDEAFVAAPVLAKENIGKFSLAQLSYYESIQARFMSLRARLSSTPPLTIVQSLPESMPISFPPSSKSARETWEVYITQHVAHPVQIACMDLDSILELIRFITKKMRKFLQPRDEEHTRRVGTWLWASLAKCPERGLLGSEEISDLRACAKAADLTWQWLHNRTGDTTENVHADAETSSDNEGSSDVEQNTEAAKGESLKMRSDLPTEKLNDAGDTSDPATFPFQEQQIILDMIMTVVGEAYGQRDLLELRRPWITIN